MKLDKLFEVVSENYLDLPFIDVASDHPIELLRLFFKEFEKDFFIIAKKHKQDRIKEFRNADSEKKNKWLDGYNKTKVYFASQKDFNDREKKEEETYKEFTDPEFTLNIVGNKLVNRTTAYHMNSKEQSLDAAKSVRDVFKRLFEIFTKLYKSNDLSWEKRLKRYEKERNDPDLFSQDPHDIKFLNKMAKKYNLELISGESYRKNTHNISLRFKEDKTPIINNINRRIKYSFQLDILKKFMDYVVKYYNNRNIYFYYMRVDDKRLSFSTQEKQTKEDQDKKYKEFWEEEYSKVNNKKQTVISIFTGDYKKEE